MDVNVSDESGGGTSEKDIAEALGAAYGLPASVAQALLSAGDALGRSLGLESHSQIERRYSLPYVPVVRGLLLGLRALSYEVAAIFDRPRGAFVEARLPTDFFSMGGIIQFDVIDQPDGTVTIAGQSEIKGQKFDWGKGKRALNDAFDKTDQFARLL